MSRCCFLVVVLLVLAFIQQAEVTKARPDPGQLAAVADALKYLQELDKYYSQVARPRFGKRMDTPPFPPDEAALAEAGERLFGHLGAGQAEEGR